MPKNSEIFSLTFFPLTASSSSYSRNIFRLKSFLTIRSVKDGLKSQLPELAVGGKSFEESLVLGNRLLEGGQVVSFQILLHLSKGSFLRKKTRCQNSILKQKYCGEAYSCEVFASTPRLSLSHPVKPLLCGVEVRLWWPEKDGESQLHSNDH